MLRVIEYFAKSFNVTRGHCSCTIRTLGYGFLFAFHSNYGSVLFYFRDKARYWSKIAIFYTLLHSTPPLGRSPSEYYNTVWYAKTGMVWLPNGKKI